MARDRCRVTDLKRYSDLAGTQLVSISTFTHDDAGRLTNINHKDDHDHGKKGKGKGKHDKADHAKSNEHDDHDHDTAKHKKKDKHDKDNKHAATATRRIPISTNSPSGKTLF